MHSMNDKQSLIDFKKLPNHIAIIMDGNGRWANEKGKERVHGHVEGVVSVKEIVKSAGTLGVKYLTLYAFSTENWNRPKNEVDALMELLVSTLRKEINALKKDNVKLHVIGDLGSLPQKCQNELNEAIEITSACTGLNLVLALSYSSRWEIKEACKAIAQDVMDGEIKIDEIDDCAVQQHLSTKNIPDPELMIRTGGEQRISNFLLYQVAYAELYFTEVHWPDFRENHLLEAIIDYQSRERRFGKTGQQIKGES